MASIELVRPSVGDQPGSLNSTRSQRSTDSKSSALELLSITDAAISALNKPIHTLVDPHKSDQQRHSVLNDGIRLLSPMDLGPSPSEFLHSPVSEDSQNISGRSSHGSRSTTASDVLIRSTLKDLDMHLPHNTSNVSKVSDSSRTSSTFLTGQAKSVKISSKKLKEITSPFDEKNRPTEETGDGKEKLGQMKPANYSQETEQQNDKGFRFEESSTKPNNKKPEIDQSNTKNIPNKERTFPRSDPHACDESMNDKENVPSTMTQESGYMTQSVKVIREAQPQLDTLDDQATPRGPLSLTSELFDAAESSPIDVMAQDTQPLSRDTSISSGDVEIMTVPETIVTVRGPDRDSSVTSQDTAHSQDSQSSNITSGSLENRFLKFHTSGLRQGMLDGEGSTIREMSTKEQVHIAKISLTDKQKQLKNAFLKRNVSTHAVRKHVIPTVVQREVTPAVDPTRSDPANDAVTTAAVAAASAVAATQPFLRAQQDLELRIAQLMEKVGDNQKQQKPSASPNNTKVESLERQLNDLTQHRLQYLEDMQKQQMQWQAQLLNISRVPNKEVPPPGESTSHYPDNTPRSRFITKTVLSDDELGLNQYKPRSEKAGKELSVLDTPAPRAKPPTPTILDDTHKSEVKGHIAGHITPDRKNKAPGGLLAQILSQDGDTPQRSAVQDTPQSLNLSTRS